jgi:hypothetical protein
VALWRWVGGPNTEGNVGNVRLSFSRVKQKMVQCLTSHRPVPHSPAAEGSSWPGTWPRRRLGPPSCGGAPPTEGCEAAQPAGRLERAPHSEPPVRTWRPPTAARTGADTPSARPPSSRGTGRPAGLSMCSPSRRGRGEGRQRAWCSDGWCAWIGSCIVAVVSWLLFNPWRSATRDHWTARDSFGLAETLVCLPRTHSATHQRALPRPCASLTRLVRCLTDA